MKPANLTFNSIHTSLSMLTISQNYLALTDKELVVLQSCLQRYMERKPSIHIHWRLKDNFCYEISILLYSQGLTPEILRFFPKRLLQDLLDDSYLLRLARNEKKKNGLHLLMKETN